MAILPTPNVDYTDLDFDSLRARLYNLIAAAFPDWTEQSVASFGNLLVELNCHVGDVLGFYMDARARESRFSLATQRASVIAAAKLIGYVPAGATAANTELTFTLSQAGAADVELEPGRIVRTLSARDPVEFQLASWLVIEAGQTTGTADAEHAQSRIDEFPASGRANQEIRLVNSPFLDDTESVEADNGGYERVENFLESDGNDLHYTLTIDSSERAIIRFGNGTNGQLPSGTIVVDYKTGGGAAGNVEPNTLRKIDGAVLDVEGNPVIISVTNLGRATGGAPRRSVAQMKVEAPQRLRVLTRTVGREDYEINAKRVGGVARALMLTADEVPAIPENSGLLYIVPAGGGTASSSLLNDVIEMVTVTYPNTLTFKVSALTAEYLVVNVQATVFPRRGTNLKALDTSIRARLAEFFALTLDPGTENERDNPSINFGFYASQTSTGAFDGTLAFSDISNVVRDTTGVRKLGDGINDFLINGAHRDLVVKAHQFPILGTVVILNGETNAPLA